MTPMIATEKHQAEILDGRAAADAIKREVADKVRSLKSQHGVTPRLAAVLISEDPASAVYVRNKVRACEEVGIDSLLQVVQGLNADDKVDGILVQLPLPKQIDDSTIIEAIDPAKDVDAFHPTNVGYLAMGLPRFVPSTPAGIIELLD